ncbi:MAG TPA: TonB-dependent receptor, partial [Bryobacteraceae bacterium]
NTGITWSHRFSHQLFMNFGYRFSRLASRYTPYFANRENVSGEAGITGNNQDPVNWGPPALSFASGFSPLSDGKSAQNRNQTSAISPALLWSRGRHNVSFGGDFRRQQFNYLSQQDPRGTFTFTGASTGSDFGGFLQGIPDAASIAFGNADKYVRESVYDAYVTDDWRIGPELSLNIGMRWEYGAPITELYGRLVNLDIAPGFAAVAPVVASDPVGPLTGERYPASLIHPSKNGFEPRVAIAWRPISGSSMVVRAGYGIYRNTSVYQTIAEQMAQQSPLSKSLRVENSAANPLTLANGFPSSAAAISNTFAIDPNFRVGYAQNWNLSVQRDLPASLQMTATYLGIKGTRGVQQFLPNTYPAGAVNPCPLCPSGFDYLTSNANSTREAAQLQLRRRLHNGLAATLEYTYSKSIDNAAALGGGSQSNVQQTDSNAGGPGGAVSSGPSPAAVANPMNLMTAQNWLNLRAERGLSSFDQRHLLTLLAQYTTGMGLHGGTLAGGWRGRLLKEWTFATQITAGSGLPQTPIYPVVVQGTGVTGTVRPDYTGAPLYAAAPGGHFLNPAAYTAPAPGQWGNAGRSTITGPAQFTLNISMGRTFRLNDKFNLDVRADAANALNNVTYTSWNTTVTSSQFGLPAAANNMRTVQITMRVRF